MDLTRGDKVKVMQKQVICTMYAQCVDNKLGEIERFEFSEKTYKDFLVNPNWEKRQYGKMLPNKGLVVSG